MKKLRLGALNYGNTEVLSREQLRKIMGGDGSGVSAGCCCEHHVANGFDWYNCGLSKAQAQAAALQSGGQWCCDSCPSSMGPCEP